MGIASQHRAMPWAGVLVPFRATMLKSGAGNNEIALEGRHTPAMSISHRLKTHQQPSPERGHTPAMGIAHRLKLTDNPALKGRHTPAMGIAHRLKTH